MKAAFTILLILFSQRTICQNNLETDTFKSYKPEIFTSGFIDIVNNGQVNSSARFIRLFIVSRADLPFLFLYMEVYPIIIFKAKAILVACKEIMTTW